MGIVYADAMLSLRQYWKENGLADDPGKRSGLNKFYCFLQETDQSYNHETALAWLEQMKDSWRKQDYFKYRRALFELDDLLSTGSVSGKYLYHDTPFSRLPKYWQDMITAYRKDLKTWKSRRAITEQMPHIITFAGYLSSSGVEKAEYISCIVISRYHAYAETVGETYTSIYSVRYFLQFLVMRGLIPQHRPYALTAPIQAKAIGYTMQQFAMLNFQAATNGITAEEFWEKALVLVQYLKETYQYEEDALRHNYTCFYQMYYVFCAEEGYPCSENAEQMWMGIMSAFWDEKQACSAKRAFYIFHLFDGKGNLTFKDIEKIHIDKGSICSLNTYYRNILEKFLAHRKMEPIAEGTLCVHKSAALSFFCYLQENGFNDVSDVSFADIKQYCIWISGKSSNGKNNYSYDLRVLLQYLFEEEYTLYDLSRALPIQSTQERKIVEILTEEEVQMIYEYRDKACTPIEYRDSAILMLGLLMGFRRIDIVNLKETDIDWKNRTISITQQKTYRPLSLPMPIPVGNSIYLYKKYGRPKSESEYIFLSAKAPYKQAYTSACGNAMEHVFRNKGRGFHILRRTFASRLLLAGTDTMKIKDSLGHSTINTVHRYLSVDEESLKACCLPLERTVINIVHAE